MNTARLLGFVTNMIDKRTGQGVVDGHLLGALVISHRSQRLFSGDAVNTASVEPPQSQGFLDEHHLIGGGRWRSPIV